jgi:hypothetical protein
MALASVKPISCAAVAPASRMWYPEIEMVFQRGTCSAHHANTSVVRRIDGAGGKMSVPRATYSFSTSFCTVPPSRSSGAPWRSASSVYSASSIAAGALIVIEVVTSARSMPSKSVRMSSTVAIDTPTRPTSPCARSSSGSSPSWVGRSNATDRPLVPCARR